jgi:hypothetical protein
VKLFEDLNIDIQQNIKEIDNYGYLKIENFLTKEGVSYLLNQINIRFDEINSKGKIKYKGTPDRDVNDKILYSVYNINHCFIELLTSQVIRQIAMHKLNDEYYQFLPPNVPNYILSYYNARSSGDKLEMHIDSYIPFLSSQKTNVIQIAILLEDTNIENGCTVVVPGSHNSGKYSDREFSNIKPVMGKAGDLIIWDSRLWHGTLANKTGKSRWALIATLSQWWCKQSVDIVRNIDNSIYQKCSDEQKQLLGFCSIPPKDEFSRNNTKCGYDFLKKNVDDYF